MCHHFDYYSNLMFVLSCTANLPLNITLNYDGLVPANIFSNISFTWYCRGGTSGKKLTKQGKPPKGAMT